MFPKMKIMQLLKNATGEFGTAYTEWKLRTGGPVRLRNELFVWVLYLQRV